MENSTYRHSPTGLTGYWEEGEEEIKVRLKRSNEQNIRTIQEVGKNMKSETFYSQQINL